MFHNGFTYFAPVPEKSGLMADDFVGRNAAQKTLFKLNSVMKGIKLIIGLFQKVPLSVRHEPPKSFGDNFCYRTISFKMDFDDGQRRKTKRNNTISASWS